jgi:hypothetical protein
VAVRVGRAGSGAMCVRSSARRSPRRARGVLCRRGSRARRTRGRAGAGSPARWQSAARQRMSFLGPQPPPFGKIPVFHLGADGVGAG